MEKSSQKRNRNEDPRSESFPKSTEDIIHEIVDYSFQKDAYMGHRIEGGYLIAYMVEEARELQFLNEGEQVVKALHNENAYIGIAVHSATDFHFIKNLIVIVTVIDEKGNVIGKQRHFYHRRPQTHNYGMNWILPCDGLYTIQVYVEPSDFKWEEDVNEGTSPAIVEVEFPHVMIKTGQHIS